MVLCFLLVCITSRPGLTGPSNGRNDARRGSQVAAIAALQVWLYSVHITAVCG
jgi:hypothetical protein